MRRNTLEFRGPASALAACLLLAVAWPGHAAPAAELSVDCPELASEARASLEARARAEIALKDLRAGHVRIECGRGRVRVEFEAASGEVAERSLALSGEPATWVEAILALVHELTSPATEAPKGSVQEFPTEATPAATAAEPAAPTPAPLSPPGDETSSAANASATKARATTGADSTTRGRSATALRFEPGAGVCSELWTNEPALLLGPCFSVGLRHARFRVAPTFGFAWATAPLAGIALSTTTAGLEAAYGERWWLGGGIQVTWSELEPPASLSPDTESLVEPALTVKGGYQLESSVHRFVIGLGLRVGTRYRDVRVDETPVFRIPLLAPLAAAEYRLAF